METVFGVWSSVSFIQFSHSIWFKPGFHQWDMQIMHMEELFWLFVFFFVLQQKCCLILLGFFWVRTCAYSWSISCINLSEGHANYRPKQVKSKKNFFPFFYRHPKKLQYKLNLSLAINLKLRVANFLSTYSSGCSTNSYL